MTLGDGTCDLLPDGTAKTIDVLHGVPTARTPASGEVNAARLLNATMTRQRDEMATLLRQANARYDETKRRRLEATRRAEE